MVNRGRPSSDCLQCRKRKLRCDLMASGCGQCRRAGIPCTGYRDLTQIIVCDETDSIRRKASSNHIETPNKIYLSWDVQARTAFFTFYVFGVSRSHDVLVSLYKTAIPGSPLTESVEAASLAFFAHHHGRDELFKLANSRYTIAIRQLRAALQCPDLVTADATLQSVLLLDLYDKITNRHSSETGAWMTHIKGAIALVNARGDRNHATHTARRLSMRLGVTLIISCHASASHVPRELINLYDGLAPFLGQHDIKYLMGFLVMDLIELKADIKEGNLFTNEGVLLRAGLLEKKFAAFEEQYSPVWRSIRVDSHSGSPYILGSTYDLYPDHVLTQGSNVFRSMRLLLHGIIQQYSERYEQHAAATQNSQFITETMAREIVASVPQFILPEARSENRIPFTPSQVFYTYSILGPLFLAAQSSADMQLRQWVIAVLRYVADVGGIEVALRAAGMLESASQTSFFNVYAMFGSYAFAP